ncbi:ankyrin repeat domain-containing protein [Pandoraea sp. XY-2]|uniref:ankyrin repeat domain-containing protein n=1 Tax=Pandoraea sp. XY-2 TaxID=2518599 RepID=UPI00101B07C4|nr:ankyrin repeat domain-containing protein [Pandoraea sp. XY-2]QBC32019.1 ankyrin repeat domain-containing protein [Pandoraea sp. XY-2]
MRKFSMIRAWMLLSVLCLTACATAATSNSALVKAVVFNDTKSIAQALKAGVDPNSTDEKGNPLLVIAMREKSVDVARLLIDDKRTDLDATNAAGENAMMIASLQGLTPMVKLLIDKDAEVNKKGWAPLHYAATNGHDDIVQILLDASAYVDAESPNGTTPLMMAARGGHITTCKVLLDGGADVRLKNQIGMTAIDFAKQTHQKEIADGLQKRLAQVEQSRPAGK